MLISMDFTILDKDFKPVRSVVELVSKSFWEKGQILPTTIPVWPFSSPQPSLL